MDAEQDQFPCRSTGTSFGNCQETETGMVEHVALHDNLSKTILQSVLEEELFEGNIKGRTSLPMPELLTRASCRKDWKRVRQGTELN